MTEQDRQHNIRALLREREGCIQRGLDSRVEAIDAELRRLGYEAERPVIRAERRPLSRAAARR